MYYSTVVYTCSASYYEWVTQTHEASCFKKEKEERRKKERKKKEKKKERQKGRKKDRKGPGLLLYPSSIIDPRAGNSKSGDGPNTHPANQTSQWVKRELPFYAKIKKKITGMPHSGDCNRG